MPFCCWSLSAAIHYFFLPSIVKESLHLVPDLFESGGIDSTSRVKLFARITGFKDETDLITERMRSHLLYIQPLVNKLELELVNLSAEFVTFPQFPDGGFSEVLHRMQIHDQGAVLGRLLASVQLEIS